MVTRGEPVVPAEKAVAPLDKIVVFPPEAIERSVELIVKPPIVPPVAVIEPVIVAEVAISTPALETEKGAAAKVAAPSQRLPLASTCKEEASVPPTSIVPRLETRKGAEENADPPS